MSMNLSMDDLIAIAGALRKLEDTGVEVSQFRCANHTIFVDRVSDQREDGTYYKIRGITNGATREAFRHTGVNITGDGR